MTFWNRRFVFLLATVAIGITLIAVSATALHADRHTPAAFGPNRIPPLPAADPTAASTTAPPSPPAVAPTQLRIPTLGVVATVRTVVTIHGVLGVPDNPADVGWWAGSVPIGSLHGSVVIDGHVDSASTGPGALFGATKLNAGDAIELTLRDGKTQLYRVVSRRAYVKHSGLPAGLFTASGPARLVLITCGGTFDANLRSYEDNIAVVAIPA